MRSCGLCENPMIGSLEHPQADSASPSRSLPRTKVRDRVSLVLINAASEFLGRSRLRHRLPRPPRHIVARTSGYHRDLQRIAERSANGLRVAIPLLRHKRVSRGGPPRSTCVPRPSTIRQRRTCRNQDVVPSANQIISCCVASAQQLEGQSKDHLVPASKNHCHFVRASRTSEPLSLRMKLPSAFCFSPKTYRRPSQSL